MIVSQKMYGVECDVCKELYENSNSGISFKALEDDIKEAAEEDGWFIEALKITCPSCMYKSLS